MIAGADVAEKDLTAMHAEPGGHVEFVDRGIETMDRLGYVDRRQASLPPQPILRSRRLPYRQKRIAFERDDHSAMRFDRLEGLREVIVHAVAQLLWTHLLGQRGIAGDVAEQTGAVDHLATLLEIDDISRQLIADLIGYVVRQGAPQMAALSVGFDVIPNRRADECQRGLREQRDHDRIPSAVRRKAIAR